MAGIGGLAIPRTDMSPSPPASTGICGFAI